MTQRIVLLIGLMMLVSVVDGAWLSRIAAGGGPDLLIIIVAFAGLRHGVEAGALLGGAAGYIEDLVTGSPLGLHTLLFVLLGGIAGVLRPVVDVQQRLVPTATAVVSTLVVTLLTAVLAMALRFGIVSWRETAIEGMMQAGLNAVFAGPMAGLMRWIDYITQRRYTGRTIGHRVLR
jgi:rod shape-determining protein MreD